MNIISRTRFIALTKSVMKVRTQYSCLQYIIILLIYGVQIHVAIGQASDSGNSGNQPDQIQEEKIDNEEDQENMEDKAGMAIPLVPLVRINVDQNEEMEIARQSLESLKNETDANPDLIKKHVSTRSNTLLQFINLAVGGLSDLQEKKFAILSKRISTEIIDNLNREITALQNYVNAQNSDFDMTYFWEKYSAIQRLNPLMNPQNSIDKKWEPFIAKILDPDQMEKYETEKHENQKFQLEVSLEYIIQKLDQSFFLSPKEKKAFDKAWHAFNQSIQLTQLEDSDDGFAHNNYMIPIDMEILRKEIGDARYESFMESDFMWPGMAIQEMDFLMFEDEEIDTN